MAAKVAEDKAAAAARTAARAEAASRREVEELTGCPADWAALAALAAHLPELYPLGMHVPLSITVAIKAAKAARAKAAAEAKAAAAAYRRSRY